eukprot:CAMPEP_0195062342 /NCGR_PEP_ID=MMETSP0448-20130528/8991_1 /TAXON_ID=66468 /ORGANISM="Heterocapsa triquestra, Strain CCMP 448" /LENGTH=99 /DNA_ID=CAMNT_0040093023 /DNA_START=41 /DNA_END=338 /DNA_ORIENTATION=+
MHVMRGAKRPTLSSWGSIPRYHQAIPYGGWYPPLPPRAPCDLRPSGRGGAQAASPALGRSELLSQPSPSRERGLGEATSQKGAPGGMYLCLAVAGAGAD